MNYFLSFIIIYFMISPFLTFLHELGHASLALILTNSNVILKLGNFNKKSFFEVKIRRLDIKIYNFSPGMGGVYFNNNNVNKIKQMVIILAGPLTNIIVSCISLFVSKYYNSFLYISLFSLSGFFATIIPLKYPKFFGGYVGLKSDGYRLIDIIKG